MAGFSGDVVRRVILKIIVDAENLASDLAKARAQLKSLDDVQAQSGKAGAQAQDDVAAAIERRTKADKAVQDQLDKNASRQNATAKQQLADQAKLNRALKEQADALRAVEQAQAGVNRTTAAQPEPAQPKEDRRARENRERREGRERLGADYKPQFDRVEHVPGESEEQRRATQRENKLRASRQTRQDIAALPPLPAAPPVNPPPPPVPPAPPAAAAPPPDDNRAQQAALKLAEAQERLAKQQEINQQDILDREERRRRVVESNDAAHLAALEEIDARITENAEKARKLAIETGKAQQLADQEVAAQRRKIDDEEVGRAIARSERRDRDNAREKEAADRRASVSAASEARKDTSSGRKDDRLDATAENARQIARNKADAAAATAANNAATNRAANELVQDDKVYTAAEKNADNLATLKSKNATNLAANELIQENKVYTTAAKNEDSLAAQKSKNQDADEQRKLTFFQRLTTVAKKLSNEQSISDSRASAAESTSIQRRASAVDAVNRARHNADDRSEKSSHVVVTNEEKRLTLAARRANAENQLAANDVIREERIRRAKAQPSTPAGAIREFVGVGQSFARAFTENFRKIDDGTERVGRFRNALRGVGEESKKLRGGDAGGVVGFFGALGSAVNRVADGVVTGAKGMSRHLFSMKGLIILAVAALGPLVAALGALGASAIAVGNTLIGLAGGLVALPGLISAAAIGIGALVVAIKPLTNVFDAYQKMQKAAAKSSDEFGTAQRDAARKAQDARRDFEDAQRGIGKALENQRRGEDDLREARKDAARQIQDYRLALQKLKFDQEGAALGLEGAEQDYRRSLADPTKNNLDRKVARHNVQGALFDIRDQKVSSGRLQEDANLAEQRGVEGTPAVVSARNAIRDAEYALETARIRLKRATEDLSQAEKEEVAGGAAALKAREAYQRELAKLHPATRAFALAVFDLSDRWKSLQKNVSGALFEPIVPVLGKMGKLLDPLEGMLTKAADALGKLGAKAIEMLGSPEWTKFFDQQGDSAAKILTDLGDAALFVADGFRAIMQNPAVIAFTEGVGTAIKDLAENFKDFANSDKGQDGITKFVGIVKKRFQEVADIIGPLFRGIKSFFFASDDFTGKFNEGLAGAARTFEKLGKDAEKPGSGFRKFLDDVLPLVKDVGHFLGAAAKAFGQLASNPENIAEAKRILEILSDKILPNVVKFFTNLSESEAFSKLFNGVSDIVDALARLSEGPAGSGLTLLATGIEYAGWAIDGFVTHVPGAVTAIGAVVAALGALAGAALFVKFTQLGKIVGLIGSLVKMGANGGLKGIWDGLKDVTLGRDKGQSANERNGRNGTPGGRPGTGGVLPHLSRIETLLSRILAKMGRGGGLDGNDGPDYDPNGPAPVGPDGKPGKPGKHRPKPKGKLGKGGKAGLVFAGATLAYGAYDFLTNRAEAADGEDQPSLASDAYDAAGGGAGLATTAAFAAPAAIGAVARRRAATTAARGAGSAVLRRGAMGVGARVAGAAAGLVNPLTTAGTIVGLGADLLFENRKSTGAQASRAGGAILTGAGIGAGIGSVVPGLGTAVGGVIGGIAGAGYSLAKDKGLRDKVSSAAGGAGEGVEKAWDGAYEGFMKSVGSPLAKFFRTTIPGFFSGIGKWFTVTLPKFFRDNLLKPIENFFTKTLPGLPGQVFDAFTTALGNLEVFFVEQLPGILDTFFTETLPDAASTGWTFVKENLLDPIGNFITVDIPNFFTTTIPTWFSSFGTWLDTSVMQPMTRFITETIPNFFTTTIPNWFSKAPEFFDQHVITPLTDFFSVTLPNFFTTTIPDAIGKIPGFFKSYLVDPVVEFFTGIPDKVEKVLSGSWGALSDFASDVFERAKSNFKKGQEEQRAKKMSGGLIEGTYTGQEDTVPLWVTIGEHVTRKRVVDKPMGKQLLGDLNEERFNPADFYAALDAASRPNVMTLVAPTSRALSPAGAGSLITNTTTSGGLSTGDINIYNPVVEKSDKSMRRALHTVAFRLNR